MIGHRLVLMFNLGKDECMKKCDVCKILLAVVLAICVAGIVFYKNLDNRSRADESGSDDRSVHREVYFEDDDGIASDTDAEIASYGLVNNIESGSLVYYDGKPYTRYYTVCKDGVTYKAYCGDHSKNAVKSTDNVSFATTDDQMTRRVFYYGPDSQFAWDGFKTMSEDDRQLVMALTINYIRHGQSFPVMTDYYEYISGRRFNSSELHR